MGAASGGGVGTLTPDTWPGLASHRGSISDPDDVVETARDLQCLVFVDVDIMMPLSTMFSGHFSS